MAVKGYVGSIKFLRFGDKVFIIGNDGVATTSVRQFLKEEVPYIIDNMDEALEAYDLSDIENG